MYYVIQFAVFGETFCMKNKSTLLLIIKFCKTIKCLSFIYMYLFFPVIFLLPLTKIQFSTSTAKLHFQQRGHFISRLFNSIQFCFLKFRRFNFTEYLQKGKTIRLLMNQKITTGRPYMTKNKLLFYQNNAPPHRLANMIVTPYELIPIN